jgi:hypothetical protein
MPVWKFRSIEEMPGESWRTPGDPRLYEALAQLSRLSQRLRPRRFPTGVYKFQTMDEMNRHRDAWTAARIANAATEAARHH